MTSLEKCLFRSSHFLIGLLVFLILSCMSCLYVFQINPFSIALLLFSPTLRVVFSFCLVSFAMQKLLIRSYLLIFVFISITLKGGSKRILLIFIDSDSISHGDLVHTYSCVCLNMYNIYPKYHSISHFILLRKPYYDFLHSQLRFLQIMTALFQF